MNTDGFSWDILKIIQIYEHFDDVNKMQIKQRWVSRQPVFRAKKLKTKRTTKKQENLKNGKFQTCFSTALIL